MLNRPHGSARSGRWEGGQSQRNSKKKNDDEWGDQTDDCGVVEDVVEASAVQQSEHFIGAGLDARLVCNVQFDDVKYPGR